MGQRVRSRIIALIFAILAAASLSSCGGTGSDDEASESTSSAVTNYSETASKNAYRQSSSSSESASSSEASEPESDTSDSESSSETSVGGSESSVPAEEDSGLSSSGSGSESSAPEASNAGLSESASPAAVSPTATGTRDNTPVVRLPSAPGTVVYGNNLVSIDCSNTASGYIMVKYTGSNGKVKMQLTLSGGSTYTYNLYSGYGYQAFPLSGGGGTYTVAVYENVSGNQYSQAYATTFAANVASGTIAFLYSNQYVSFNANSACVAKGAALAAGASSDLDVVANVYNWTINNVTYDFNKAANATSGYLPNPDSTLSSCTGICFDYAALMCAMLRSQNIPTRLVIGWSGSIYHAWISVYITNVGWLNDYIYFDGTGWKRMDPTFAAGGSNSKKINDYINNGANYNALEFH